MSRQDDHAGDEAPNKTNDYNGQQLNIVIESIIAPIQQFARVDDSLYWETIERNQVTIAGNQPNEIEILDTIGRKLGQIRVECNSIVRRYEYLCQDFNDVTINSIDLSHDNFPRTYTFSWPFRKIPGKMINVKVDYKIEKSGIHYFTIDWLSDCIVNPVYTTSRVYHVKNGSWGIYHLFETNNPESSVRRLFAHDNSAYKINTTLKILFLSKRQLGLNCEFLNSDCLKKLVQDITSIKFQLDEIRQKLLSLRGTGKIGENLIRSIHRDTTKIIDITPILFEMISTCK